MGMEVKCRHCGNKFYVHGYEEQAKCFECDSTINPQNNKAH